MFLVAHQFGRVEFRIFVVFYRQAQLKKSKQIFEIRNVQIDELPRTQVMKISHFCPILHMTYVKNMLFGKVIIHI